MAYPENTPPSEPQAYGAGPVQPIPPQPFGAGPAPAVASPTRRNRKPLLIGVVVALALMLVGGGVAVAGLRSANVGPFKDSGLAMCEAIRDGKNKPANKDQKMTPERYQKLRKPFADSRYADIRDSGTKFVDLVWQLAGTDTNKDGALGMVLMLGGQTMQSYSSLSGACANHGVVIPPLSQN